MISLPRHAAAAIDVSALLIDVYHRRHSPPCQDTAAMLAMPHGHNKAAAITPCHAAMLLMLLLRWQRQLAAAATP